MGKNAVNLILNLILAWSGMNKKHNIYHWAFYNAVHYFMFLQAGKYSGITDAELKEVMSICENRIQECFDEI